MTFREALEDILKEYPRAAVLRVSYDGAGDSGCVEEISISQDDPDSASYNSFADVDLDDERRNVIDDAVCEMLTDHAGGWEIDEGSFGTAEINLRDFTVSFDHMERTYVDASFGPLQIGNET